MIGLVLLLTAASITLTNGIPIEVNSPYLEYPGEYKENYKYHNYFNLPKTSYELRPQIRSDSKKPKTKVANYHDIVDYQTYQPSRNTPSYTEETKPTAGSAKAPSYDNIWDQGKRSFKSQELHEKLIALGLDYIEATNIIEALHRLQRKIDDKNVQ